MEGTILELSVRSAMANKYKAKNSSSKEEGKIITSYGLDNEASTMRSMHKLIYASLNKKKDIEL